MSRWRMALPALLAFAIVPSSAAAEDFSAQLDRLWNFGQPAESETKFRAELARHPAGSREALEATTQIARAQGLRRQFPAADATLDSMHAQLQSAPARVRVRYLLERGRTRNSGGDKPAAVALFKEALAASERDTLPESDYYRVDALHMLGIAAPAAEQLDWNKRALAAAEASKEARARGWAASLNNNIGWTYFETGDPATALAHWRKALAQREAMGSKGAIVIARWTVARGHRALGQLDDAERIQLALVAETEREGAPDGYVYEELAEIELARGNTKAAAPWAGKAYALLKDDPGLKADAQARLDRLARLAQEPPK